MTTVAETAALVHGYTMADVNRMSRKAARWNKSVSISMADRIEAAWMGIVEALYSSQDPPSERDLVRAGLVAVTAEIWAHQRDLVRSSSHQGAGVSKYWHAVGASEDFTEEIAERLALPQVLSALTAAQYDAIAALAAHGNTTRAAAALGISPDAMSSRTIKARKKIKALWFAPETPRNTAQGQGQKNGRCAYGHDLAKDGWVSASSGRLRCRICHRDTKRRAHARGYRKPSVRGDGQGPPP